MSFFDKKTVKKICKKPAVNGQKFLHPFFGKNIRHSKFLCTFCFGNLGLFDTNLFFDKEMKTKALKKRVIFKLKIADLKLLYTRCGKRFVT